MLDSDSKPSAPLTYNLVIVGNNWVFLFDRSSALGAICRWF